ncbi:SDR family NAD(P)-dependent oxidoreductase [Bacillus sp. USDA818B3_A]|uniref:SDR family NAD(P)-dependent oxidoreductase n=1 Tax=Bacillus sp. USDA818B3_A TaxID=2698834 RepID=UPI00136968B6|nr:SDR family oxidoreductase [Bacillus sp. USDA818B3_A]
MGKRFKLEDYQGKDLLKEVGFDRVPTQIIEKSVPELLNLKGKKAVITGAGGPGLGQACANRLAGSGADVAVVDINFEGAKMVAERITERWGTRAIPVKGDITDWEDVQRMMRESHEKLGGIDILVNNAVAGMHFGDFVTAAKGDIDKTVQGTLTQLIYLCRTVLDYMIPQGSGRIINVGAEGGRTEIPDLCIYDACKAGVHGFTRNLSAEVARHGIYVLGVAPGVMMHEGLQYLMKNPTKENWPAIEPMLAAYDKVELERVELPEEVANMVAFLASDAASSMCGVTVNMGGGISKGG